MQLFNNSNMRNDDDSSQKKIDGNEFWQTTLKKARLVLAPMVDQSELAWRMLSRRYGCELCYTPMLHASVFVRNATYRKESLISCKEDRPLIVQFCANDPETFLEAAKLAAPYCDAVDLNLGCPQSIAKRGHYGAFLQEEWDLLFKMVNLAHRELQIPVTCKIRIFENSTKTVHYAQMLEAAGCQLLTVHGRTRDQKGPLTGVADWNQIKAVKQNVNIPVFANGNIQFLSDVYRCFKETGVDGVMSAEGNLHNPAIFHGLYPPVWEMAEEYLDLVEKYPAPTAFVRGHLFKIFHHSLQIHIDLRDELAKVKISAGFREVTKKVKDRCLDDLQKYKDNHFLYPLELPFPHWICQPYVRPSPEEAEKRQLERQERSQRQSECSIGMKRPFEFVNCENGETLSKNKIKKMMRHPSKCFKLALSKYEKCQTCGNPKGLKCIFSLCKVCCKKRSYTEVVDCVGHNFMFKTKKEKREQWKSENHSQEHIESERLEDYSEMCDVVNEDDTGTNSTTSTICD